MPDFGKRIMSRVIIKTAFCVFIHKYRGMAVVWNHVRKKNCWLHVPSIKSLWNQWGTWDLTISYLVKLSPEYWFSAAFCPQKNFSLIWMSLKIKYADETDEIILGSWIFISHVVSSLRTEIKCKWLLEHSDYKMGEKCVYSFNKPSAPRIPPR